MPPPLPPSKLPAILLSSVSSSPPNLLLFVAAASALSIFLLSKPLLPRPHPPRQLTMSNSNPNSNSITFSSPESLSDFLRPHLPLSSSWGLTPGTKSLTNLFLEISQGESFLSLAEPPNHPLRSLHVVTVRIRNRRGAVLVETAQLLSDGSVRQRGRVLSEKMKPGETPEEAAVRAVREELGKEEGVRVVEGSCRVRVEERDSVSYPGLKARYVLHQVDVEVEGLVDEGEFSTDEIGEGVEAMENAVFVKTHFWKWVDDYEDFE